MSLFSPPAIAEGNIPSIILIGHGATTEYQALSGVLAEILIERLAVSCYVFDCSTPQSWPEAINIVDTKKFDLSAIISVGTTETLGYWLQGSGRRLPGTMIINIGSKFAPPLAITTHSYYDVVSVYSEDNLEVLAKWSNAIGARHKSYIIQHAHESFAGFYMNVAEVVAKHLSAPARHEDFFENTKNVAKVPRKKQVVGVKSLRDAGGYNPVPPSVVFSSSDLVGITRLGKQQLRALGIKTVLDMRPSKYKSQRDIVIDGINVVSVTSESDAVQKLSQEIVNERPVLIFGLQSSDVQSACSTTLASLGVPQIVVELDAKLK